MGRVSDAELLASYRSADVFLLPSNQEGFGIVYVEAMRQGCPVIAGNHGGAPEVVDHGVTGFLVEHGDEEAIATRVAELLEDPELRTRMGLAARARVEELFTHRRFSDRMREILAGAGPAPVLAGGG
jgi:glycosyltransferase involved in cell wall biosynthesis